MSDLPTRAEACSLIDELLGYVDSFFVDKWDLAEESRRAKDLIGDLLTREEAANDPEVRRMVIKEWKNKTRWEVTDDG